MTDPIPTLAEGRWLWRRLYVFAGSAAAWTLLALSLRRMDAVQAAATARGLMALLALTLVLYLVAPTAQQLIALSANLRLRLAGGGR